MNTKNILLTLLLVTVLAVGLYTAQPANAQTLTERIEALKQQIANLQQRLLELLRQDQTSVTWCYTFNRNLSFGNNGTAVASLRTALIKEGLYTEAASDDKNTFNEKLASGVVAFQQKYASEILAPSGLKYATGYVGQATRAKLNSIYGCTVVNPNKLTITNVSGPTSLNVNQSGTWTVSVTSSINRILSYSVTWGDEANVTENISMPQSNFRFDQQTLTINHTYKSAGNYNITFRIMDNLGNTVSSSITVVVRN